MPAEKQQGDARETRDTEALLRREPPELRERIKHHADASQEFHDDSERARHSDMEQFLADKGEWTIKPHADAAQSFYDRLAGTTTRQEAGPERAAAEPSPGREMPMGQPMQTPEQSDDYEPLSDYWFSPAQDRILHKERTARADEMKAKIASKFGERPDVEPSSTPEERSSYEAIGRLAVQHHVADTGRLDEFRDKIKQEWKDTTDFFQAKSYDPLVGSWIYSEASEDHHGWLDEDHEAFDHVETSGNGQDAATARDEHEDQLALPFAEQARERGNWFKKAGAAILRFAGRQEENERETAEIAKRHSASTTSLEELHENHAEDLQRTIDSEFTDGSASRLNPFSTIRDHLSYAKIGRLAVEQAETRNGIVARYHEKLARIDTTPALTEAAARGLAWKRGPGPDVSQDADDMTLQHDGKILAGVNELWDPNQGPKSAETIHAKVETYGLDRGGLQDRYATLPEGMKAAEAWAVESGLKLHGQEQETQAALEGMRQFSPENPMGFFTVPSVACLSAASQSFYDRLAATGGWQESGPTRDAGDRDLGFDR